MCLRAGLLGHVDTVFVSVQELGQRTSCDSTASYLPSWESCRGVMTVHLKRSPYSVLGAFHVSYGRRWLLEGSDVL